MTKDVTDVRREFGGDRLPSEQHETDAFPVIAADDVPDRPEERFA